MITRKQLVTDVAWDGETTHHFLITSSGTETPKQSCPLEESSTTSTLVAAVKTAPINTSSDSEEAVGNHRGSSLRLVRSRVKNFLSGSFGRGEGKKKKRRKRPEIQDSMTVKVVLLVGFSRI